jgi:hypothetical protein
LFRRGVWDSYYSWVSWWPNILFWQKCC